MSTYYTKASFALTITANEAALVRLALRAGDVLRHTRDKAAIAAELAQLGPDFAAVFPGTEDDPAAGFLDIFDDRDHPILLCSVQFGDEHDGQVTAVFSGNQFTIDAVAGLIQRTCGSALPFGFEYALDNSRLEVGEIGGGYAVITADGIEYRGTSMMLADELQRLRDPGAAGQHYVLARPSAGQLDLFWNGRGDYGPLADALPYTEQDARRFYQPRDHDDPQWLTLPRIS